MEPSSTPIMVAATMNGSEVAWRRPAATAPRAAGRRAGRHGRDPADDQQAEQEHGHQGQGGRVVEQGVEVEGDPAADEEDRHEEAVADGLELHPELRVGHGLVAVDEADDGPGDERAEDGLQAEVLGQDDEHDDQQHGARGPGSPPSCPGGGRGRRRAAGSGRRGR